MLVIGIYRPFTADVEFGAFEHPSEKAGIDTVLHGLRRFEGDASEFAGIIDHLKEQAAGVGHLNARRIHFRMDDAGLCIDIELRPILRVGQARHTAHHSVGAVRTNVTIDTGLCPQRCVSGLTHNNHFAALSVIDVGITRRRPFD